MGTAGPLPSLGLKQGRKRCARWLETNGRRLKDECCNPDFWASRVNRWVAGCVGKRVIVSFCIFETVVSSVLVVPFLLAPQIAMVGVFTDHWQTIIVLLSIRAACGVMGAVGVHIRKVGRTKIYFGSMIFNLVLSTFVASPLHECMCGCPNMYETRWMKQCKVIEEFTKTVHLFRTKHVVQNSPGRPALATLVLQSEEQAAQSWEWMAGAWQWLHLGLHWPWQPTRAQEPQHRLDLPRLLAAAPLPDPSVNHRPGDKLKPEQIRELLGYFNVTDPGIGFTRGPALNCTELQGLNTTTSAARRSLLLMLQCQNDEMTELIKGLDPLQAFLEICTYEPSCEAVVVRLVRVASPTSRGLEDEGDTEHTLRVCRYEEPVVPFLDLSELENSDCMCKNRCVAQRYQHPDTDENCTSCRDLSAYLVLSNWSRKKADLDEAEFKIAKFYCRLTVTLSIIVLIVLNVMATLMTFVVYRFLQNRCGDEFCIEEQFHVRGSVTTSGPDSRWSVNTDEDDFVAVDLSEAQRRRDTELSLEMRRM